MTASAREHERQHEVLDEAGTTRRAAGRRLGVLVVDDEENLRHFLELALAKRGYDVHVAADGLAALELLDGGVGVDFILTDLRMPRLDGLGLIAALRERELDPTVIVMTAFGTLDVAVEAMKRGAYDYVSKPFKADEIELVLVKAEERERLKRENLRLRRDVERMAGHGGFVSVSPAMEPVLEAIERSARVDSTVLITGESGTGKELVARALHARSSRRERPFVAVNCGAIHANLLESELFGHLRGAFTGAHRAKRGLFEEADGGTLLLDEIGDLPLALQSKLLRVLQEREVLRLGDTRPVSVDVRVLAATAQDLEAEVAAGRFREDLFYRLNVVRIRIPPLRDRPEDLAGLVEHLLARLIARCGRPLEGLDQEALERLARHRWPGNVRELENVLERAVVLCGGPRITAADLDEGLGAAPFDAYEAPPAPPPEAEVEDLSIKRGARALEQRLIRRALERTGGNRTHAARILEISHRALLMKIKGYGIDAKRGGARREVTRA